MAAFFVVSRSFTQRISASGISKDAAAWRETPLRGSDREARAG